MIRALRRRALLGAAAAPLPGCGARGDPAAPLATPIGLPESPPDAPLEALGGLVLNTAAIGFGGLSGLHIAPDLGITAISDLGHWLTARLVLQGLRPTALADLRTGPLRDGAGDPLTRGRIGDAESLARMPDGTWLIGFERWHRIRAYRTIDGPSLDVAAPPGLERAPSNQGLEALAVLADGRWLAIAEALPIADAPELLRGWLGGPGRWQPIAYRPAEGHSPVDAAPLADGGALVLERRFSLFGGFGGRLVRVSAAALRAASPTEPLAGTEILRIASPLPVDNFEAVSVTQHGGGTLIALLSDDNQSILQRSLMLLFALREG